MLSCHRNAAYAARAGRTSLGVGGGRPQKKAVLRCMVVNVVRRARLGPRRGSTRLSRLRGRSAGRPYPPSHDRSSRRYTEERVHIHPISWGHFTAAPAPQRLLRASASKLRPAECQFYRTPSRDRGEVTTATWIAAAARELSSRPVARCLSRRGFMTWLCVLLLCTNGTIPPCDPPSPWSWPLDIPVITEKQRPHLASS